jgi:hypothetical protein
MVVLKLFLTLKKHIIKVQRKLNSFFCGINYYQKVSLFHFLATKLCLKNVPPHLNPKIDLAAMEKNEVNY